MGNIFKKGFYTSIGLSKIAICLSIMGAIITLIFYGELGTKIYLTFNRDLQQAVNMLFYKGNRYKSTEELTNQVTAEKPLLSGNKISYNCIFPKHKKAFEAMKKLVIAKYGGNKNKLNFEIRAIALYQSRGDREDNLNIDFGVRPIFFIKDNGKPFNRKNCTDLVRYSSHRVATEYLLVSRFENGINKRIVGISAFLLICGGIMNIIAINLNLKKEGSEMNEAIKKIIAREGVILLGSLSILLLAICVTLLELVITLLQSLLQAGDIFYISPATNFEPLFQLGLSLFGYTYSFYLIIRFIIWAVKTLRKK